MASIKRTYNRDHIKKKVGHNHIQKLWKEKQVKKYTFINWFRMKLACDPAKRRYNTLCE